MNTRALISAALAGLIRPQVSDVNMVSAPIMAKERGITLVLNKAQVVCTPGAGFGKCGEGHVRISAFNSRENVVTALSRIAEALK